MSDAPGRPKQRSRPPSGVEQGFRGALLGAGGTGRLCKADPPACSAKGAPASRFCVGALGVLAATMGMVTSAGAQEQVEVFQLAAQEVRGVDGARVFYVDAVERFTTSLSAGLPADPARAAAVARQRFDAVGQADRQAVGAGAEALALAAQYRLAKVPAIVFDRRAVVYGVLDVDEARALYRAWRARGG